MSRSRFDDAIVPFDEDADADEPESYLDMKDVMGDLVSDSVVPAVEIPRVRVSTAREPPHVYFIGEDWLRMQPFLQELEARGVPTIVWNTGVGGSLDPTRRPPPGVFYCRQSPSAWTRGNTSSARYALEILKWLEFYGATVVNGSRALEAEMSKAQQIMYLHGAGLNTVHTTLNQGHAQAAIEASFHEGPVLLKPNHGGSGTGILQFATGVDAATAWRDPRAVPKSHDNLWLMQTLLGKYSEDVTVTKSIIRIEFVDGVQRDYFIKITAPSTEFSLCPCDPRFAKLLSSVNFMVLRDPAKIPGFDGDADALAAFCSKIEDAFRAAGGRIGSVEAMVLAKAFPEQAAEYAIPHEPVLFEMNFNTNYNDKAEETAGITPGVVRVANLLEREFRAVLESYGNP